MCTSITFPKGLMTMNNKRLLITHNAKLYRKASKKLKTNILDELSMLTGLSRKYISYLIRKHSKRVRLRRKGEESRLRKRKEGIRFYELTMRIIRLKNELERIYNRKRGEGGDESNKKKRYK